MDGVSVEHCLSRRGIAVDPDGRTLRVGGRKVELDSRSLAVLRALAERFGERVGKDHLLAAAWPNQVVHENSLAKAVSRLRHALEGSEVEIVASYGVGYSLRDVAETGEATMVAYAAEEQMEAPRAPTRSKGPLLALGALILLVAASTLFLIQRQSEPNVAIRETAPITHDRADSVATILWVDDNPSNNALEVEYLKRNRVAVHQVRSTDDALKLLRINDYRLIVSDLGRGDDRLAGLKMTQAIVEGGFETPVIIYTVRPDEPDRQRAQRQLVSEAGAADLALTPLEVRTKVMDRIAAKSEEPS